MSFLQGASAVGNPEKHLGVVKIIIPIYRDFFYVSVVDTTVYTQVIIPLHIPSLDGVGHL